MDDIKGRSAITDYEQLVVFKLEKEHFGVNIESINGIVMMDEITKVPKAPNFIEGVINLRGSVIPVLDLRKRFGLEATPPTKSSRIVVVELSEGVIGMIVDEVSETFKISSEEIDPPSSFFESTETQFVKGVAKKSDGLVIILDLSSILTTSQMKAVSKIRKKVEDMGSEPKSDEKVA